MNRFLALEVCLEISCAMGDMRIFACLLLTVFCVVSRVPAASIVIVTVEDPDNYESPRTMRDFSQKQLAPLGHRVSLVLGDTPQKHHFEGLTKALEHADLLVLFSRRRFPPLDQMAAIRAHLDAGKPLVGIRTAHHAFAPKPGEQVDPSLAPWPVFAQEVLGCQNAGYETRGLPYRVALAQERPDPAHASLLAGVDPFKIFGHQSLYKVLPLAEDARPLLTGIPGEGSGALPQPIAWTRLHGKKKARIFYTSLGAPQDMELPDVLKLLQNAVSWALMRD
jgi:type 1 glutamine amidotransferase